jgi:hypothetical protein
MSSCGSITGKRCLHAAADDHAWPECASTAPGDHSFVRQSQPVRLIAAIICPFDPPPPIGPRCTVGHNQIPIAPAEPGASLPALSFSGGFRTTPPVPCHRLTCRHPKPLYEPDVVKTLSTQRRKPLSSLLWCFLLFDRASGFLPPRP